MSNAAGRAPSTGEPARTWSVYLLECAGDRLYAGISPDVERRFRAHREGRGAAFTRAWKPRRILAALRCGSRSEALKLEYRIKHMRRPDKLRWARTVRAGADRAK